MPNWREVPDHQRSVELRLRITTNMNAEEIGGLIDSLCLGITEFGKEHLKLGSRYENVYLIVDDPGGFRVID